MNNDENILFEYPLKSDRKELNERLISQSRLVKRLRASAFGGLLSALICYLLSAVIPKSSFIFFILTVIFVVLSLIVLKVVLRIDAHILMISANDKTLELDYVINDNVTALTLSYDDISSVRFADKSFKNVSIAYLNDSQRLCFASYKLNEYSYEQGFFLYIIAKIIPEKCLFDTRKIAEKYGFEYDYFNHIQSRSHK